MLTSFKLMITTGIYVFVILLISITFFKFYSKEHWVSTDILWQMPIVGSEALDFVLCENQIIICGESLPLKNLMLSITNDFLSFEICQLWTVPDWPFTERWATKWSNGLRT
jgi:hypothetical protein